MIFNRHSHLEGQHAVLSASKYHWINYTEEKLENYFRKMLAAQEGSELHDLAAKLIKKKIRLPKTKQTINRFVNDAIGFRMNPEQLLYHSEFCFGTADAISFRENEQHLRIFDLKTGESPTSMHQLEVYAGMFCHEYKISPAHIKIELRLYQNDAVEIYFPPMEDIINIMGKMDQFSERLRQIRLEELS
jgi:hypothetical protein